MAESDDTLRRAMRRMHEREFSFAQVVEILNDSTLHLQQAKRSAILDRFRGRMRDEQEHGFVNISIGGDDSWDTVKQIIIALKGWHVSFTGLNGIYELAHVNDLGIYVWPINNDGSRVEQEEWSFISANPGNAYPHFQGLTTL